MSMDFLVSNDNKINTESLLGSSRPNWNNHEFVKKYKSALQTELLNIPFSNVRGLKAAEVKLILNYYTVSCVQP